MEIFEFVLVTVSLVLALGFTSLLSVIARITSQRRTRKIEWYPTIWIAVLFLHVQGYWWSLWDFRDVEWTFPIYFFLLLMPTFLFIAISLLGEALVTDDGRSRVEAFEGLRIPFFASVVFMLITGSVDGWLMSVEPPINILRWIQVFLVVCALIAALTPRLIVQKVIAVINLAVMIFAMFGLRYLPGAFSG